MIDIIEETAQFWIEQGGDAEGITWSWMLIRDEARRIEHGQGGGNGD